LFFFVGELIRTTILIPRGGICICHGSFVLRGHCITLPSHIGTSFGDDLPDMLDHLTLEGIVIRQRRHIIRGQVIAFPGDLRD